MGRECRSSTYLTLNDRLRARAKANRNDVRSEQELALTVAHDSGVTTPAKMRLETRDDCTRGRRHPRAGLIDLSSDP